MNPIRTPRIATWLLNHFGCSPRNDELLGDLIERYRSGRSRTWYWKQVLLAVLSGFASEIGTHKSRVLAALTAGWAFLFLYEAIFVNFFESLNPNSVWVHYIFTRLLPDGWRAECGWAYRHSYDYVLLAIECAVGIVAGFVVARCGATYKRSAVLAFSILVLMFISSELIYRIRGAITDVGSLYYLYSKGILFQFLGMFTIATLSILLSILFGGGILSRTARSAEERRITSKG